MSEMRRPILDLTINLGHLVTLGGFVLTAVFAVALFDARLKAVEQEVAKLSDVVIQEARFDERLKALEAARRP
jgi:hypothetical protein